MNISNRTLTDIEVTVLQKGLNYAIPNDKENVPGFVASVENAVSNLRDINDEEKVIIRHQVCGALKSAL